MIKMIEKHRKNREQVEIFSIEEFVPAPHLRKKAQPLLDLFRQSESTVFGAFVFLYRKKGLETNLKFLVHGE